MSGQGPYLMLMLMFIANNGESRRKEGAGYQEKREGCGLSVTRTVNIVRMVPVICCG